MGFVWNNIVDGESGSSVRGKINDAIAWLLGKVNEYADKFLWEDVTEGGSSIKPTDDKGVQTPFLSVTDDFIIPPADGDITINRDVKLITTKDLYINNLAAAPNEFSEVYVDDTGKLIKISDVPGEYTVTIFVYDSEGVPQSGWIVFHGLPGYENQIIQFTGSVVLTNVRGTTSPVTFIITPFNGNYNNYHGTLSPISDDVEKNVFLVPLGFGGRSSMLRVSTETTLSITSALSVVIAKPAAAQNVQYALPDATENEGEEFTVRKGFDGYALAVHAVSGENIVLDDGAETVITTDVNGAWVTFKSDGTDWHVIQDSGNWELDD